MGKSSQIYIRRQETKASNATCAEIKVAVAPLVVSLASSEVAPLGEVFGSVVPVPCWTLLSLFVSLSVPLPEGAPLCGSLPAGAAE